MHPLTSIRPGTAAQSHGNTSMIGDSSWPRPRGRQWCPRQCVISTAEGRLSDSCVPGGSRESTAHGSNGMPRAEFHLNRHDQGGIEVPNSCDLIWVDSDNPVGRPRIEISVSTPDVWRGTGASKRWADEKSLPSTIPLIGIRAYGFNLLLPSGDEVKGTCDANTEDALVWRSDVVARIRRTTRLVAGHLDRARGIRADPHPGAGALGARPAGRSGSSRGPTTTCRFRLALRTPLVTCMEPVQTTGLFAAEF